MKSMYAVEKDDFIPNDLMDADAITNMVHCWDQIGQGSSKSDQMLKNPRTGNVFHRIALFENIVCGIRFWILGSRVHFRFRLERQLESDAKTRSKLRVSVEEAVENVEKILEYLELKEPNHVHEDEEKELAYELI